MSQLSLAYVLWAVTWYTHGLIETLHYTFKGSAFYSYQLYILIGLSALWLIDLIFNNLIGISASFLKCISNCLHIHSLKVQIYLLSIHLSRYDIVSLNICLNMQTCCQTSPVWKRCQPLLTHSWVEMVMRDDGSGYISIRRPKMHGFGRFSLIGVH